MRFAPNDVDHTYVNVIMFHYSTSSFAEDTQRHTFIDEHPQFILISNPYQFWQRANAARVHVNTFYD